MTARSGVAHQPGLDGLRGLAVAAVVLFHTGLGWLPGGFLGRLAVLHALGGRHRHGDHPRVAGHPALLAPPILDSPRSATAPRRVDRAGADRARAHAHPPLLDDHRRRHRRFVAARRQLAVPGQGPAPTRTSSPDRRPCCTSGAWRSRSSSTSSSGLLAIGIAAVSKRPARTLGIVAGAGAVVSFALPFLFSPSIDRVYYGTDTRAGELLVGLVLASWLSASRRRTRLLDHSTSGGGQRHRRGDRHRRCVATDRPGRRVDPVGSPARGQRRLRGADRGGRRAARSRLSVGVGGATAGARCHQLRRLPHPLARVRADRRVHGVAVVAAPGRRPDLDRARRGQCPARSSCPSGVAGSARCPLAAGFTAVTALLVAAIILPVRQSSTDEFLDQLADDAVDVVPATARSDLPTRPCRRSRATVASHDRRRPSTTVDVHRTTTTTHGTHHGPPRHHDHDTVARTRRTAVTSTTVFQLPRRPQIVVPGRRAAAANVEPGDLAPVPDVDLTETRRSPWRPSAGRTDGGRDLRRLDRPLAGLDPLDRAAERALCADRRRGRHRLRIAAVTHPHRRRAVWHGPRPLDRGRDLGSGSTSRW